MDGPTPVDRLLLVFNADSGRWNAWLDSARKALNLNACTLCALTHGLAGERDEWRAIASRLGVPIDSVHRDETTPELDRTIAGRFPCVLVRAGATVDMLLGPDEIAAFGTDLEAFERAILERLDELDLTLPG